MWLVVLRLVDGDDFEVWVWGLVWLRLEVWMWLIWICLVVLVVWGRWKFSFWFLKMLWCGGYCYLWGRKYNN